MQEEEIIQLEKKVQMLTDWKNARKKERLSSPLDFHSRIALDKGLFVFTGRIFPFPPIGLAYFSSYAFGILINDKKRRLVVTLPTLQFTINAATDVFTNVKGQHNLKNGDTIGVATTSLLPAGLFETTSYFVINRTGNTFQVSLTLGGPPVGVTDTGLGQQYWVKIPFIE